MDFYRNKRVLVTGHTGFKGGWLCAWLELLGSQVGGFALPCDSGSRLPVEQGLQSILGDLRDESAVLAAFSAAQPEIVFHLAAQPLVRVSYKEPVATFATNVMGTVHVLEAARRTPGVRAVVAITSDKCYENREWLWGYRENEAMGGADPYSASKGCAELVAAAYMRSFGAQNGCPRIATCRAGNVIGGGDWAEDRLVPDIARAILAGQSVVIRNPHSTRPWQHVLEPLRGYLMLGERLYNGDPCAGEGWNFGPGADADITVIDLARRMIERWCKGDLVIRQDPNAPHEAHLLRLDSSKARARLGWQPLFTVNEAIDATVEWYRACSRGPHAQVMAFTQEQIRAYMERAHA